MTGKKISDLDDGSSVSPDTLIEISQPIKTTQSDGTQTTTGWKSMKATIGYIIALLKNTAMTFPWLSVKGIDSFSELDTSNGMQIKFNAASDTAEDDDPLKLPNMSVTGYGNAVFGMPAFYPNVSIKVGNSYIQAATKDLSNVDGGALVTKIDTQRGSAPVLSKGAQSNDTSFTTPVIFTGNITALNSSGLLHYNYGNGGGKRLFAFQEDGNIVIYNVNTSKAILALGTAQPDSFRLDGNIGFFSDNVYSFGQANIRAAAIYAANGTIQTSDERLKDNITPIPDKILDIWESLSPWCQFTMVDSQNDQPRLHLGAIAQRVIKAFADAGEDAFAYGLACYDTWEESTRQEFDKMVDVKGKDGTITQTPTYKDVVIPAGDRYSLRYDECLVLEAALQRRITQRLKDRVTALENK